MNIEDLQNYIKLDYQRLWDDLKEEYNDSLDSIENKNIRDFIYYNKDIYLGLDESESTFNDNKVTFCFSAEYDTANESNNQNEWFMSLITYDFKKQKFTCYETDQG